MLSYYVNKNNYNNYGSRIYYYLDKNNINKINSINKIKLVIFSTTSINY